MPTKRPLDFLGAAEECLGLGKEYSLPEAYTDELKEYIINKNITSSWTGFVRVEFTQWRWINGSNGKCLVIYRLATIM